ncbi:glycosyltransferase [Microbacterium sp.]|uniref:glycosyltransferase n=1 Tax=Microbacterium sp. TaxID=51671 RepID=UPI0028121A65|nr:glycosyltransferase [Microbacterium sp.]
MPARVHAVVVARSGHTATAQLTRTLEALRAQTLPPAAVTVVVAGNAASVRGLPGIGRIVEGIIEARTSTTFAEAVALAQPRVSPGSAVWLLAQDTVPEPEALQLLAGALERSPSAAISAPKLVRDDDEREIVSLGVSMSTLGRTVELAAHELDQGQHDATEDALGADVRGMLVRGEAPTVLRPDPALGGADEGLDLGVRARLGGARVVLVPQARIAVTSDGPAALPKRVAARAWVTRRAQLHRRLAYAPAALVPLHWLSLLPLALWRSITHLVGKRPAEVAPEWGAAIAAMLNIGGLVRARRAIREFHTASWSSIAPLRVSRTQLRQRLDDGHGSERGAVSELHFFGGGGAWAVLAALVVSIACFTKLLAWPALGGGALLPMRQTIGALWADATWGLRGLGEDLVGPADPFAAVLAVLGTLWPGAPSFALILLWLGALPLAVLGGWFAATRVTDRAGLRILGGVLWALAPTFLTALVQGRPAAVILHLLLPWVFHTAAVAHRSWGAAGAASVLTAGALACAPSLAPAFVLLCAVALVIALVSGRVRGAVRVIWLLIPSVALFAPLIWWQLRHGEPWALLADPGAIRPLGQAGADAAGRTLLATGFPSPDRAGWEWFAAAFSPWTPLLVAPVAVLALAAALSPRWRAGYALLLVAFSGLATSVLAVGVVVSFWQGAGVPLWPGTGLSLAWLGVVGAALVTLDTIVAVPRVRTVAAATAGLALAVVALPSFLAVHTAHTALGNGPESTLPALVAAQADGDADRGTLVVTPLNDGSLAVELVWGPSATLGAQTTMLSTATRHPDDGLAENAVDLISARDFDASAALAERGVGFVLLARTVGEQDRARSMREAAITAVDQRTGFVKAGETERGMLWRIEGDVAPRGELTAAQEATSRLVSTLQIIVVLAAVLLSIPTRASRRAARSRSRIVGRAAEEPMVLPRRRDRAGLGEEHEELVSDAGEHPPEDVQRTEPRPPGPEAESSSAAPAPGDEHQDTQHDAREASHHGADATQEGHR